MNYAFYQVITNRQVCVGLSILTLAPQHHPLRFRAGQYVEIRFPHDEFLPFSIANPPNADQQIELHIRHGKVSDKNQEFIEQAIPGTIIRLRGALGCCCYDEVSQAERLFFIAGGTGFAQAKALIEQALLVHDARPLYLFRSMHLPADNYLANLPPSWQHSLANFTYQIHYWQTDAKPVYQQLLETYPPQLNDRIFLSGSFSLVQAAADYLIQHQVPRASLISDRL